MIFFWGGGGTQISKLHVFFNSENGDVRKIYSIRIFHVKITKLNLGITD